VFLWRHMRDEWNLFSDFYLSIFRALQASSLRDYRLTQMMRSFFFMRSIGWFCLQCENKLFALLSENTVTRLQYCSKIFSPPSWSFTCSMNLIYLISTQCQASFWELQNSAPHCFHSSQSLQASLFRLMFLKEVDYQVSVSQSNNFKYHVKFYLCRHQRFM
jgi:hypothetical protein